MSKRDQHLQTAIADNRNRYTALVYEKKFELWKHLGKKKGEITHQVISFDSISTTDYCITKYYFQIFINTQVVFLVHAFEGTHESVQHVKQELLLAGEYSEY